MNRCNSCNRAVAHIRGGAQAPNLRGCVRFQQMENHVCVEISIQGLPQNDSGFYGFHIHEGSRCTGVDFADTGSHYNPENTPHPRHAGDLPPLLMCCGGACQTVTTDRFRVAEIIGRTVVIHSMADDFRSQPAGDAGTKIGCGVIYMP